MRVQTDLRKEFNSRPERDAWFESITPELERIEVPMLVCGSFSDQAVHSRGALEAFRRVSSKQKWLYTRRGRPDSNVIMDFIGLEVNRQNNIEAFSKSLPEGS